MSAVIWAPAASAWQQSEVEVAQSQEITRGPMASGQPSDRLPELLRSSAAINQQPSVSYGQAAWIAVCRSQAVAEFDMSGRIAWANDKFLAIMGYALQEIVGLHHRKMCFDEQSGTEAYRQFWGRLARGEYDSGDYIRRRSNGSSAWLQATYNPVLDEHGHATRVLKVATDVTHQVELEHQVKGHLLEAQQLQTALEQRSLALARSVVGLGDIARSIGEIADQTSMLALNTSIEATRAGNAGRGFGVVTSEIKRLAESTRAATKQAANIAALPLPAEVLAGAEVQSTHLINRGD